MDDDGKNYDPKEARKQEILSHFRARLDETTLEHKQAVEDAIKELRMKGKSWKWAYGGLLLIVAVGGSYLYYLLKKHHLIGDLWSQ